MCIFDLFIIKLDIQITEYSQEKEQECRMLVDALKIHKIGKHGRWRQGGTTSLEHSGIKVLNNQMLFMYTV